MIFKSSQDLADLSLKVGDVVIFHIKDEEYTHIVRKNYLENAAGNNSQVFNVLGIDKTKIAKDLYGYPPYLGGWPEYADNDMLAAKRLIMHLFNLIEAPESIKPSQDKCVCEETACSDKTEPSAITIPKRLRIRRISPECEIKITIR